MKIVKVAVSALSLSGLLVASASAQVSLDPRKLIGKTCWGDTYHADGRMTYRWHGRLETARWKIEGAYISILYPNGGKRWTHVGQSHGRIFLDGIDTKCSI